MKIIWWRLVPNISSIGPVEISNSIAHGAPALRTGDIIVKILRKQHARCYVVRPLMGFFWREERSRMNEFAADDERPPSRLRHAVVGCAELCGCHLEAQGVSRFEDLVILVGAQELRHVLHHENLGARMLDDLEKRSPKLLPGISIPLLIQKAETLAGRAPDHDVGFRDLADPGLDDVHDVIGSTVFAEVGVVGPGRIEIEIIGPDWGEDLPHGFCEAERHAARAGEEVD